MRGRRNSESEISLRLQPKLRSALIALARHEDLTVEQLIRRLIIEAIDPRWLVRE